MSLSVALGTEIRFPIPGQDWEITIEGPVLNKFNIAEQENGQIKGMANAGRFNVTLFVEPPPAGSVVGTHTACRDFYWTQAKRSPHIVEESILFSMKPNCQVVGIPHPGHFSRHALCAGSCELLLRAPGQVGGPARFDHHASA